MTSSNALGRGRGRIRLRGRRWATVALDIDLLEKEVLCDVPRFSIAMWKPHAGYRRQQRLDNRLVEYVNS
jgi:hypothetical protein